MTVGELRAALENYPADLEISLNTEGWVVKLRSVYEGYNGGLVLSNEEES